VIREDLAWAAGFLDGEGNFRCQLRRNGRGGVLGIHAAQVDRRPLDRLAAILGGAVYGPYKQRVENHSEYYSWSLYRTAKAKEAIALLLPFLSEPKREQAQRALEVRSEYEVAHPGRWARRDGGVL
jgi:hypothetical protein